MKIFISQPMIGFTKEEIVEERKRITDMFYGNEFVDNYDPDIKCPCECKTPRLYSLGLDVSMMRFADLVILPTSTWGYPGSRVEEVVAELHNIPVVRIPMYPNANRENFEGELTCEAR